MTAWGLYFIHDVLSSRLIWGYMQNCSSYWVASPVWFLQENRDQKGDRHWVVNTWFQWWLLGGGHVFQGRAGGHFSAWKEKRFWIPLESCWIKAKGNRQKCCLVLWFLKEMQRTLTAQNPQFFAKFFLYSSTVLHFFVDSSSTRQE